MISSTNRDMLEINIRVASLLRLKESSDAIKRHQTELEATVDETRTESAAESQR